MPLLSKRKVIAARVEVTAGVAITNLAAADADFLAIEPASAPDVEQFDRDFVRSKITRLKGVAGQSADTLTFGMELKGTALGTYAGGAPNFGTFLQSAGFFEQSNVGTLDISGFATYSPAGPFRHGELVDLTFEGGTPGTPGVATVVHDTHDGATVMYIHTVTAPLAGVGHTGLSITGQSSGTIALDTAIIVIGDWTTAFAADQAYSWWPISDVEQRLETDGVIDNAAAAGDVIEGLTSGARAIFVSTTATFQMVHRPIRGTFSNGEVLQNITQAVKYSDGNATIGTLFTKTPSITAELFEDGKRTRLAGGRSNVSWNLEVNRPIRMDFETRGLHDSEVDAPLLTGITYDFTTPPLWKNTALAVFGNEPADAVTEAVELTPAITTMSIDMGNTIADRKDAAAATGLQEIIISEREGSGSIDPEATLEADISWLGELQSGDVQRYRMTVGTAAGNQFYMTMPGIQYESISTGDRDAILTQDVSFKLTGGNLHNLAGATVALDSTGGDNEFVLTYITSG